MAEPTTQAAVARAASVAVVWLLVALATAVALVAAGVVPTGLSLADTVSLLVAGGVLLVLVARFVRYFAPDDRLF